MKRSPQVKKEGYPKSVRIKREYEFRQTFLQGSKIRGEGLIIFKGKRTDKEGPKFGIKVGRGIKTAARRNKIKRLIKEVLRKNQERFGKDENVIVLYKSTPEKMDPQKLKEELERLIGAS
jgi:ribonuclease P protein component